jgi:hypothetical protein
LNGQPWRDTGPMATARELLDLMAGYVTARTDDGPSSDRLQEIAQRFDVAVGELIIDRASVQNEG